MNTIEAIYKRRSVKHFDATHKLTQEEENKLFDEPYNTVSAVATAPVSSAPSSPPPNHQGYMQDGYEVSEYPAGSGKWWWKDAQSGTWSEWK